MIQLLAHRLVAMAHVAEQHGEHHHLIEEIEPRHAEQHRDDQSEEAGIEGQDIGHGHQRQALGAKLT